MILKLLLKIWPSLIPLSAYVFWIIVQRLIRNYFRKKNYIEGEFEEVVDPNNSERSTKNPQNIKKTGDFSLKNPKFLVVIYVTLILVIGSLIFFAFS